MVLTIIVALVLGMLEDLQHEPHATLKARLLQNTGNFARSGTDTSQKRESCLKRRHLAALAAVRVTMMTMIAGQRGHAGTLVETLAKRRVFHSAVNLVLP